MPSPDNPVQPAALDRSGGSAPIQPAKTAEEFIALGREWDAAQIFACQSDDADEVHRANVRLLEVEDAIDRSPFEYDGDGNLISK